MIVNIPPEVKNIAEELARHKYKAYLVGGCLRDLILSEVEGLPRVPKDWDIATDATPGEIQSIFAKASMDKENGGESSTVYENEFGTVGVKTNSKDQSLKVVEVTTFRKEGKYTDKRHPDEVRFAKTIKDDLSRRDFTVNAMAMELKLQTTDYRLQLIDPYEGQKDLKSKLMRTVGDSKERFTEDALRLMRAVRLAIELEFEIEKKTAEAIKQNSGFLEFIAKERIRDEFSKIIMTRYAADGIRKMQELNLLKFVIPELVEGVGVGQNKHHIYTVFEHNVRALEYSASKSYSFEVRLASLLHDVGKPKTKHGNGVNSTFYGHEIAGGEMTLKILDRLKFSKDVIEKVAHLVRYHLFYYNVGEVSAAGVRRFIARVGSENIDDLIKVREADRIGSGVPKAVPYKLRHLLFMIEKVKRDPVHPKMLFLRGDDVMKIAKIEPSPRVGYILGALLLDVLENPELNKYEVLEKRVRELAKLSDAKLIELSKKAKGKKEEFEGGIEEEIKKKYWVR